MPRVIKNIIKPIFKTSDQVIEAGISIFFKRFYTSISVFLQRIHAGIEVALVLFDAFLNLIDEFGILPAQKTTGAENAANNYDHACNKLNDFTSREEALMLFDGADLVFMRCETLHINIDVAAIFFLPIVSDLIYEPKLPTFKHSELLAKIQGISY